MSNSHHRYSNSADVHPSQRSWQRDSRLRANCEEEDTRAGSEALGFNPPMGYNQPIGYALPSPSRDLPPLKAILPGPPPLWQNQTPTSTTQRSDAYDGYRRSAGNTPLGASQGYQANVGSPISRQYNPQDYAQVSQSPQYRSSYEKPGENNNSPGGYKPYNPARYAEQVPAEMPYFPPSPVKVAPSNSFRNTYQQYQAPPPLPPKSVASSPAYHQPSYYAQSQEIVPPISPTRPSRHGYNGSLSRIVPPVPPPRDTHTSMPSTPTSLHRDLSATQLYGRVSGTSPATSLSTAGGAPGSRTVHSRDVSPYEPTYHTETDESGAYYPGTPLDGSQSPNVTPGLERSRTTGRHPQARTLPTLPPDAAIPQTLLGPEDDFEPSAEELAQDELYAQVERAMRLEGGSPSHILPDWQGDDLYMGNEAPGPPRSFQVSDGGRHSGSRTLSVSAQVTNNDHDDEEDSPYDAEAAAGIAAMQAAEEEEAALERRRSHVSHNRMSVNGYRHSVDLRPMDDSIYAGSPHLSVGAGPMEDGYRSSAGIHGHQRSVSSRGSMMHSADGRPHRNSSGASLLSFAGSVGPGYIDQAGTGGFLDNTYDRRLSFDEGDESGYFDDQSMPGIDSNNTSPKRSGTLLNRPLPPPPEGVSPFLDDGNEWGQEMAEAPREYPFPAPTAAIFAPGIQTGNNHATGVPRSMSLLSPRSPQTILPDRAKTDAEERRKRDLRSTSYDFGNGGLDAAQAQTAMFRNVSDLGLDLPVLPTGRRFQPAKLTSRDFDKCKEPWALSELADWLKSIADGESELREQAVKDTLVSMFTYKVPNINIADAEELGARVVSDLQIAEVLVREEDLLPFKFGWGTISGVLFQLTGSGCYAPQLHEHDGAGKCYAHLCQRTVKRISADQQDVGGKVDWATFYKVKKEDVKNVNKKEMEKQNVLHEIVTSEYGYSEDLGLLRSLYRDGITTAKPPLMSPQRLQVFLPRVFGKIDAVQHANQEFLLPQLRYRQQEQGPWINGFSDIFRDWIRKAKVAYIEYAAGFPIASLEMKQEEQKNGMFSAFLEATRNKPLSRRLGWDSFLRTPITRLQRYGLLLQTVLKNMEENGGPEVNNLKLAIEEIREVTQACDDIVAVKGRKAELVELNSRLILREEMKKHVELNLENKDRELLLMGDLQRMGANKFTWLETHAILLDNYLILAKSVSYRHLGGTSKSQTYDVSKMPIPMRLLELDSIDEDPVTKSSVRGVSAMSSVPLRPSAPSASNRSMSIASPSALTPTTTNTDVTLVRTNTPSAPVENDKTLYPFKVKHLGHETYTLYATRAEDRRLWCEKILEAKTKHAAMLFRQHAEPFTVRVLADAAFANDTWGGHQKTVLVKGTSLSRAIDEVERRYANVAKPVPICRAKVNCATTFCQADGRTKTFIGTDYGVYLCESGSVRDWIRILTSPRVTQLAVLEDFNLLILIADKSLIAYHLDAVCPIGGAIPVLQHSAKLPPQKLSGQKDIAFFSVGKLKDRTLIFYKKKEGLQSIFKILEPILARSSTAAIRSSALTRTSTTRIHGTTETFREYDEFKLEKDSTDISIFTSSIAVATTHGFDVLNLDKKTPFTIPELTAKHTMPIAKKLDGVAPLGMFRLTSSSSVATSGGARMHSFSGSITSFPQSNAGMINGTSQAADASAEFILVYEECAIYVNKHGEISRSVHMEFVGKAKAAALVQGFLVLFDTDFVEVRDAQTGRLKQIIVGREVRCLDDGRGGGNSGNGGAEGRTVKVAMQHPSNEKYQIVVELVLNRGVER